MTKSQNKKTALFRVKGMEWLFVNLPYVCFLTLLAVGYIANSHAAEHNLRKIESLKKEVKDALNRIYERDEKDWPIVALALAFDCPIWTEDQDFFGIGIPTWRTKNIEIFLQG